VKELFARLKARQWRVISANAFMLSFILLTGVGAYMILPAAGFITAGVASGLYGYLLGSD